MPVDFFIKAAFTPVIPIYGELNELFGAKLFLPGLTFGIDIITSRRAALNAGFELAYCAYLLNPAFSFKTGYENIIDGFYYAQDGIFFQDFNINVVLQKKFNKRKMAVSLRSGCGITFANGFGDYDRKHYKGHFNLGSSFLLLLYERFHLETGADFSHITKSADKDASGLIKPKLALVWKF